MTGHNITVSGDSWTQRDPRIDRKLYIRYVLACYRCTPTTTGVLRPDDPSCASEAYDEGVSIELFQAALILAAARRSLGRNENIRQDPIRSLRYFLPLIKEIKTTSIDRDYLRYLENKLIHHGAKASKTS